MERGTTPTGDLLSLRLDAARADLTAARQRLDLLAEQRQRLVARRDHWDMRFQWFRRELNRGQLREYRDRWTGVLAELERQRHRRELQVHEASASVASLDLRLQEGQPHALLRRQLVRLNAGARLEEDLRKLDQAQFELERNSAQIDLELADFDLEQRLAQGWETMVGVWNHEVLESGGSSVTLGKVVLALVLVILGFWASRWLSARLIRRILHRSRLDQHAVAVFQTLVFYFFLIVFFFRALRLVNIPLTIFMFLGGAIATGIGFGSQNIVNNFASGLILIAERPVKVGDLIDIDGVYGCVEQIGARSTRIRSSDNTHVIVPNSTLFESKVLNWMVSDNVVRSWVDVGVVYGSDLDATKKNVERALSESPQVLAKPTWEILLTDFGADALTFRTYFWTEVPQPVDQWQAQSEVRLRIDALFREARLVIAFPQRDFHLDTAKPLEVLLQRDEVSPLIPRGDNASSA